MSHSSSSSLRNGEAVEEALAPARLLEEWTSQLEARDGNGRREGFQQRLRHAREMGTDPRNRVDARKRLMQDLRRLQQCTNSSIVAGPIKGDLFNWRAVIPGPDDTAWEGGVFKLQLTFSDEYPCSPPAVRFVTKNVFHPNVYTDGRICLDTLKMSWSSTLDVETLLMMVVSLLSDPNPASAANSEAAQMFVNTKDKYEERVRRLVEESLEQSFSDDDDESDAVDPE